MESVILSTIPLSELKEVITAVVRHELTVIRMETEQEKFLSPKETCTMFSPKVSLPTLNSWAAKGSLIKYHIGGRTFYKQSEVMGAVKELKRYSRAA